jgi:hypothetical protein
MGKSQQNESSVMIHTVSLYGRLTWEPTDPTAPLDALLRRINRLAEHMFQEDGALETDTLWLIESPKGQAVVVTPITAETREEAATIKDAVGEYLRALFAEHGVTRYAMASEVYVATPPPRASSELPDDEGTVYYTAVPGAPFQVTGRRGKDGNLYVSGICDEDAVARVQHMHETTRWRVEIVTGPEAEALITTIQKVRAEQENPNCRQEAIHLFANDGRQTPWALRNIIRPPHGGAAYLTKLEINQDRGYAGERFAANPLSRVTTH